MMNENPAALIPEMFLLAGAVVSLLAGSFVAQNRQGMARNIAVVGLLGSCIAAVLAAGRPATAIYGNTYALDAATSTARILVPLAGLLAIAIAFDRIRGTPRETEFYVLVLLACLGSVVQAGASDLLILAVSYLLASIPLYALIGWGRDGPGAEGALKIYLLGALLGIVMLVGMSVLYGIGGGNTDYARLAVGLPGAPAAALAFGLVAVVAGLLFKVGAVPAHFWLPDSVEGATTGAAAFVTTVPKIGGLIALYRLMVIVPDDAVDWPLLVAVIAAVTMTWGNLAAFTQTGASRLLAYSTISQAGYLLMAVAVARRSEDALPALLLYLVAYAASNLGAFAVLAATPSRPAIADFRGLLGRRPALTAALAICLLGLVGTPPTAVFIGKVTVFSATWDGDMAWLVVLAAVNTVASLYYYLRWLAKTVEPRPAVAGARADSGRRVAVTAALTAATATVVIGLFAGPLLTLVDGTLAR